VECSNDKSAQDSAWSVIWSGGQPKDHICYKHICKRKTIEDACATTVRHGLETPSDSDKSRHQKRMGPREGLAGPKTAKADR